MEEDGLEGSPRLCAESKLKAICHHQRSTTVPLLSPTEAHSVTFSFEAAKVSNPRREQFRIIIICFEIAPLSKIRYVGTCIKYRRPRREDVGN